MNATSPTWIERLLGIDAQAGEGLSWSLDHAWRWPPWLTLLFVLFTITLVVWVYRREGQRVARRSKLLLIGLRLSSLALVTLMIAQLTLSLQRTGLPYLAVIVDDSLSMGIADRYEEPLKSRIDRRLRAAGLADATRWNLARTLIAEDHAALPAAIAERYKLRFYYLTGLRAAEGETAEALATEIRQAQPTGPSTRLGAAVRSVLNDLRGNPPAAIVLLTDGVVTEGPSLAEAAPQARRRGVPLITVGLGDDRPVRDVRLSDLLADDVVFAGDVVSFEFKLSGTNLAGQKVEIVLRAADKPETLARLEAVVPPDGQSATLHLPYRPTQLGTFRYVIEAASQANERDLANNRLEGRIEARHEPVRVLLVQGYPNYEYRYLRNLLAREPSIDLHTVLQEADPEHAGQERGALAVFPVRRDELLAYDLVILADANPALFGQSGLGNLARFVNEKQSGGALMVVAGPRYMPWAYRDTPLAPLLPIVLATARQPEGDLSEGFRLRPTAVGLSSPPLQLGDSPTETEAIWSHLPPLYWMVEAEPKPAARVLAEHPTLTLRDGRPAPLILLAYVGAGRVLFQSVDETWRWRWRAGDIWFARYWIQTIRYLARGKLGGDRAAELLTDRRQYEQGEAVRLRLQFGDQRLAPAEDDGAVVVVEQQGQKTQRLRLHRASAGRGTFEASLAVQTPGEYHAWLAVPTLAGRAPAVDFRVLAPPGEMAQTRMDSTALRQAAEISNGHYYTFQNADQLLDDLPEGRQVPIETLPPKPLWNRWPLLILLLLTLTTEWLLRKRAGLK
jgi:hypothetical protein